MERGRGRRYDDRDRGGYSGSGGGYRREERPRSRSHERRRSPPPPEYRRSPPPRDYERPREYERRRSRSPYGRDRSPGRSRNGAPPYRDRSPPRARHPEDRERYERREYESRDGSRRFPVENNYRPSERARSPPRRGYGESPRSQPLSRRGSPPPPERTRSPGYHGGRSDRGYHEREVTPPRRARSPPREVSYRDRSPPPREETFRERTPARPIDDEFLPDADAPTDYDREDPPTGPSYRGEPVPSDGRPPRSEHRDSPRGGYHGSSSSRRPYDEGRYDGRPAYDGAPREGRWSSQSYNQGPSRFESRAPVPAFRGSSNSTATTYPRTQRFNNGTSIVEGGKKQPSLMDPEHEKRLLQLEEERKRLEAIIEEKQRKKRSDLRDWEKLEREAKSAQLRSELAEGHLERLSEVGNSNVF